jgi:hypothetical protein
VTARPEVKTTMDDCLALWQRGEVLLPEATLLRWLRRNRLLPLLGWRAEAEGWTLPDAVATAIHQQRLHVAVGQILVDQQLAALGELARQLEIPVVLVKGAAAAQAYPAPWMHPFGDIDVLVDAGEITRFYEALRATGYAQAPGTEGMRAWHLPPLIPAGRGARVEIHPALSQEQGRWLFTVAQWQARLQPAHYPGLLAPHPVDHVLYLVHHALIHHEMQMGLQTLSDLWFWTRGWDGDDWAQLETTAAEAEMARAVGLGMALTRWFWPAPIAEAAAFPTPSDDVLAAAQAAISGLSAQPRLPNMWRDAPTYSVRGALAYVRTVLWGDTGQLDGLPWREQLAYHIHRPSELLRNHGTSLWQLLTGDPATRAAWRRQRDLQRWLRGEERSNI